MSPTMTEGGIAGWKKQEGEEFTAGDVLLEIVSVPLRSRYLSEAMDIDFSFSFVLPFSQIWRYA
jgi:hypothetical protein